MNVGTLKLSMFLIDSIAIHARPRSSVVEVA